MRAWQTVSRHNPCPICGKPDWCAHSTDGIWALCRRLDTGAGIHKLDKAGADYWLYRLDGHSPCRQPIIALPSRLLVVRADPVTLDRVYRALLAALALSSTHRQRLRQRGLSDVEMMRRCYRTLPLHGRPALAQRLVDRFGPDVCSTIPGLYIAKHNGLPYWSIAGAPGLLIPVRNVDCRIVALKVRSNHPVYGSKYTYLSSTKHDGPGSGAPVHVPIYHGQHHQTIRLTEGELKADVATVLSGLLTLAVPGVSVWRQVLPVLQQCRVSTVHLAFDADWRTNPHVAQALGQAACALLVARFDVQIEDWDPAQGKGIDDVLVHGHSPVLQSAALAFGASLRGRARVWTGMLVTRAAEEGGAWHSCH